MTSEYKNYSVLRIAPCCKGSHGYKER